MSTGRFQLSKKKKLGTKHDTLWTFIELTLSKQEGWGCVLVYEEITGGLSTRKTPSFPILPPLMIPCSWNLARRTVVDASLHSDFPFVLNSDFKLCNQQANLTCSPPLFWEPTPINN